MLLSKFITAILIFMHDTETLYKTSVTLGSVPPSPIHNYCPDVSPLFNPGSVTGTFITCIMSNMAMYVHRTL